MKTCKGCGETKPLDDYYANKGMADGRVNWCKPCMIARHGEKKRQRARELRAYVQAIKMERGCVDCGYRGHPAALEFDHLPGTVKVNRLAVLSCSNAKAVIHAEINKCEVVCANCHRIRTAERLTQAAGERSTAKGERLASVPCW